MKHYDVVVIGGGVIGLSAAYGLAKKKVSVLVLDEGNQAFRASRSNFGLVWFQGKGQGNQHYVDWTKESAKGWAAFAKELEDDSDIATYYRHSGGLHLCMGDEGLEKRKNQIKTLIDQSDTGSYDCEFIDRPELEKIFGSLQLGDNVKAATYSENDGHVNPLYLLHALQKSILAFGGQYSSGHVVEDIKPQSSGGFEIITSKESFGCDRVFIAAGLGSKALGAKVGIEMPVVPERGQILVTQPVEQIFPYPMSGFRQTEKGTIMVGFSNENVGIDDSTSVDVVADIANKAVTAFPQFENINLVRAWAGVRIQSPDKYPVYARSKEFPGAFSAICHSGITLCNVHAEYLPNWILSGDAVSGIKNFPLERFNV